MYFWYGVEYAGGGASYSLHIKAGLVRLRDGSRKGDFPPRQLKPWFFRPPFINTPQLFLVGVGYHVHDSQQEAHPPNFAPPRQEGPARGGGYSSGAC